jgi:hypothetical protein
MVVKYGPKITMTIENEKESKTLMHMILIILNPDFYNGL